MSSSTARPGTDNHEWAQATEKAKEAAASVSEMASLAAAAVGAMASHAASNAGVMASQDVGKKADELAANAGANIQGLGDMISKNSPESGLLKNASEVVAGVVKEGGEYLHEAKLSGLTEDVTHVIRRNPIQSVLIALGVGWFIGRTLKG